MKTHGTLWGLFAFCAGLALAAGPAQAAQVLPVGSGLVTVDAPVTVTVPDGFLPVVNQPATFQVTAEPGTTIDDVTLVGPPLGLNLGSFTGTNNPFLTSPGCPCTSAYPGRATNAGDPNDLSADVTGFSYSAGTVTLTPTDAAAMIVLQVLATTGGIQSTFKFILPADGNTVQPANGIPDSWEATFCPGNACLTGLEDLDLDGLSAFDEFRGLEIAGTHKRFDPRAKDLVVGVRTGQCGGPTLIGGNPPRYPTSGGLLDNLANLLPAANIHVLGFSSGPLQGWVDNLSLFDPGQGGFVYTPADGAVTDRQINRNALYPILDTVALTTIQRGIRGTECAEANPVVPSPVGSSGVGTPNNLGGNVVIYSKRIVENFNRASTGLIAKGQGRKLRYSTYVNGAWSAPVLIGNGDPTVVANVDVLISEDMKYVIAHEMGGHSTDLVVPVTAYQNHYATFTGDELDLDITCKVDKKTAANGGFNTCYIPRIFNDFGVTNSKLRN